MSCIGQLKEGRSEKVILSSTSSPPYLCLRITLALGQEAVVEEQEQEQEGHRRDAEEQEGPRRDTEEQEGHRGAGGTQRSHLLKV